MAWHFVHRFTAFALLLFFPVLAQSVLSVSALSLDSAGNARVRVPLTQGSYYILYRGETIAAIRGLADIESAPVPADADSVELVDDRPPRLPATRFYRVEQVPLGQPKDSDGDGLDDVYELGYRPGLDPINPFDAAIDPDQDGVSTLGEYRRSTHPFSPNLPPAAPQIAPVADSTLSQFVALSGRAPIDTYLRVEGGATLVTNTVQADGTFQVNVPLQPNRLNRLLLSAVTARGETSAGQPLEILQDSQPPTAFIDFPTNGMIQSVEKILVAGRVGDGLSGYRGLRVWVHSSPAEGAAPLASTQFPDVSPLRAAVDVGIGANGTYERSQVPLIEGLNTLSVMAVDTLGNRTLRRVTVTRTPLSGSRLIAESGDSQSTNTLRRVASPLVVRATQADGVPLANTVVTFDVTRSNGRLLPADESQAVGDWRTDPSANAQGAMRIAVRTDAGGFARAQWTLGSDAGCANNRVCVVSDSIANAVYFCATALSLPAAQINIGSGNNQRVETGALTPEPLRVWVSDGLNPVGGVSVTYRALRGGGLVPGGRDGSPTAAEAAPMGTNVLTVTTGVTGHASVGFVAGPVPGLNVIEASFPGSPGRPAMFQVQGLARYPDQPGSFSGIVLDNTSSPIGGAYCELTVANFKLGQLSDASGRFRFENVPGGMGHLFVNGSVATRLATNRIPTNSFPSLSYSVVTVANASNSLSTPVLLPRLNPVNARVYFGTNDLVLTCEGITGLKMKIRANSMSFPDGTLVTPLRPAVVSLNQVHHDDIPMPMPDGVAPPFAWTLQPGGAHFKSETPVEVEYPNMSGLAPGSVAYFLSFNHDTERFEIVASGQVTSDGATILTDPESGLTISGWGCNCPPYSVAGTCVQSPMPCQPPQPSYNGCGAAAMGGGNLLTNCGLIPPVIPGLPPTPYCFTMPCDFHDLCYGTCGFPKAQCDQTFLLDMLDVCSQSAPNNPVGYSMCATRAYAYYSAVAIFGGVLAYAPAQEAACVCENSEKPFSDSATSGRLAARLAALPEPVFIDNDHDALPDDWEREMGLDPTDPTDFYRDADNDGLSNFVEFMFGFHPFRADSDGNGVNDYEEAARISPALNRPGRLDEAWQLQVGGQSTQGDLLGNFSIDNITLADVNGTTPGSGPDFYGDELVRLTGVNTSGSRNRYVTSDFFRIRQGARVYPPNIVISEVPPKTPESLALSFQASLLTRVGQTSQLRTIARYADGSSESLDTDLQGTTYRVSNPAVIQVDARGKVTAMGFGHALVTASNQGATATATIDVAPGSSGTTMVRGRVLNGNGTPAVGVTVTATGLAAAAVVTGADGTFSLVEVSTAFGPINVVARIRESTGRRVASVTGLVAGNLASVDAGTLTLAPVRPIPRIIAGGQGHAVALKDNGSLWAWGRNNDGQLGDGTRTERFTPIRVGAATDWAAVTSGERHSIGIRVDGTLWAWGYNGNNQLGDGTTTTRTAPRQIGTDADWAWVDAGANHTLALKRDGSLWGWGMNDFGQLARETLPSLAAPTELVPGSRWRSIAGGRDFTDGIREDGTLWSWGSNGNFQLADGTTRSRATPMQMGSDTDWEQAAAGGYSGFAIKTDGSLSGWGLNTSSQLGLGDRGNRAAITRMPGHSDWWFVTSSGGHTIGVKLDGTAWGWGGNGSGIILDQGITRIISPNPVAGSDPWQTVVAPNLGGFTLGIDSAGGLWTWGLNDAGQLATGRAGESRVTPTRVSGGKFQQAVAGNYRSAAIGPDGEVYVWGIAPVGDGSFDQIDFPLGIPELAEAVSLACGDHTLAVLADGSLWGWGRNSNGELGIGKTSFSELKPIRAGNRDDWREVAPAIAHSMGITTDGALWTWGNNASGELGLGTTEPASTPTRVTGIPAGIVMAAGGAGFSVALHTDGSLWSWGDNSEGQLGDGTTKGRLVPARVGADQDWTWVAAGGFHVLAVKADGSLWVWGRNRENQLGDGTRTSRSVPTRHASQTGVRSVAAGLYHSGAIRTDGSLWMWGRNGNYQLGDGASANRSAPVRIGIDTDWSRMSFAVSYSFALKEDGSLWAWGDNDFGSLGTSHRYRVEATGWGTRR